MQNPDQPKFEYKGGKLFLDKEGRWFHEGVEITHKLTAELFSRSIKKDEDGRYVLEVGQEWAPVQVEDTPFMVRRVDVGEDSVRATLNDGSEEELDLDTLRINDRNVLYCDVKNKEYPARFLRPAYYQLMNHLVENESGYAVKIGNRSWHIENSERQKESLLSKTWNGC
ncbi:MAG: DUF1285 domain-containing protein [bacterium]